MALQKNRLDTELLHAAIVDGINVYLREVLVPHGILEARRLEDWQGEDLEELKHAVAGRVAATWETCQIDEGA